MSISDKLCEELRRLARATPMSMLAGVDRRSAVAMERAADRIELLESAIRRLAEQDATLSVCDGAVTVTRDATLTDEEREAVAWAAFEFDAVRPDNGRAAERAATLRGLLERMK